MIKIKCKNCEYSYYVTEAELIDNGEFHKCCLLCGGETEVINITEILESRNKEVIKEYVNNAFKTMGIEGTIEAVEHLQNQTIKDLYQEELRIRGVIK
jgi:hypothetical protein